MTTIRLPDYIIIGAAKSATTTLYGYLSRHPEIFMSEPKEPEFFARDDHYARGLEHYSLLFKSASSSQLCGEASTIYSRAPIYSEVPERISKAREDIKLVYIMREPISRIYSDYAMILRVMINTKQIDAVNISFEQALEKEEGLMASLKPASDYLYQIRHYLKYFNRDQMIFLLMEDLIRDPEESCKRVLNFLGINGGYKSISVKNIISNTKKEFENQVKRNEAARELSNLPFAAIAKLFIPRYVREKIYDIYRMLPWKEEIGKQFIVPKMKDETRKQLSREFKPKVEQLAEFLDRDLTEWLNRYEME